MNFINEVIYMLMMILNMIMKVNNIVNMMKNFNLIVSVLIAYIFFISCSSATDDGVEFVNLDKFVNLQDSVISALPEGAYMDAKFCDSTLFLLDNADINNSLAELD